MGRSTSTDLDLGWFERERGITSETLEHFGVHLGEYPGDGKPAIVTPYSSLTSKYRRNLDARLKSDRWFRSTEGHKPWLFNPGDAKKPFVFLVEGETDAMRLWQELGPERREKMGVVALGGPDTWLDSMADAFKDAKRVYVVLDNDDDYNARWQINEAWKKIRRALPIDQVRKLELPGDVNDVCEFFENYDVDALSKIVKALKKPGATHYHPLDLTKTPPSYDWLVDGMLCKGDITLLQGEPNVGKSFLTMGLCIAIATGQETFLGRRVRHHGRVLYIDEENPEDIVLNRLRQLGLHDGALDNVRYLWEQGIRLDRDPEKLLDEALNFEPELIVIDSLTRVHRQDENNNAAMAVIGSEAIKPLARKTGATVIVLHHTNKGDSQTSMKRTRGAAELNAFIDTGFDCLATELGDGSANNLLMYKTRRGTRGQSTTFRIEDTPEGKIALTHIIDPEPPF